MYKQESYNIRLNKVRKYKYGKKTAHLWDFYILPTKKDMLDSIK